MSMGGSATIGYRYFMSLHMGLARGPLDEIVEIKIGGLTAWDEGVCNLDGFVQQINKPELFGGDKKEGGVQGPFRVYWGEEDQTLDPAQGTLPSIAASLGGLVPFFRGCTTVWFHGMICAMNPYPKEWQFRVRRYNKGWFNNQPWYPEKAVIYLQNEEGKLIKAMNGAHIIYQCMTDPNWGSGTDPTMIDENSFVYAANSLCAEGLGLCLKWARQSEVGEFIQTVVDHIGCSIYTDRETGLETIKLIRNDYDPDDLPLFTPDTGLLSIMSDDSSSQDTSVSEVVVNYTDPVTNETRQGRAQSTAQWQAQRQIFSTTSELPGLPTKDLANRRAAAELKVATAGLKRYKVRLDRRGYKIAPAGVFKVSDPSKGVAMVILRAADIDDTTEQDGSITIAATEDVFGFPETAFIEPQVPIWTRPETEALPPIAHRLIEAGYRDLIVHASSLVEGKEATLEDDCYVAEVAAAPSATSLEYDLMTRAVGEPTLAYRDTGAFTATAVLATDISALEDHITVSNELRFPDAVVGTAAMIGDEIVRIDQYYPLIHQLVVSRGCADTIPSTHSAGVRVWLIDDDLVSDGRPYADGEDVEAKALTRTYSSVLAEADAPLDTVTTMRRAFRPYPVADLKVATSLRAATSIFALTGEWDEPIITWVERNRLTQDDQLVSHTEGAVAAEAGTTYTVRVYDKNDTLLRTDAAAAAPWTYDAAMQTADGDPTSIYLEVAAVRDGVESRDNYHLPITLTGGYGYGYGLNYGGA